MPSHHSTKLQSVIDMKVTNPYPLITRRCMNAGNMTWVWYDMKKGAIVPKHSHPNEQLTFILKGKVQVTIENSKTPIILQEGDVFHIQPNVVHTFVALKDTIDIDVFHPRRKF